MNDDIQIFFETEEINKDLDPSISGLNENKEYSFQKSIMPMRKKNKYNMKLVEKVNFKLNNYGHRSENFYPLDTNKVNILFVGCSETFGEGLPEKHSWPYYVINEIKKEKLDLGSQHILSFPGGSIDKIVINVFKYIDLFGVPDYIIFYMPDIFRIEKYEELKGVWSTETVYDFEKEKIKERFKETNINELLRKYVYSYDALRIFCKVNNVKFLSSSWNLGVNKVMKKNYPETFREFSVDFIEDYYMSKDFNEEYFNSLDRDFSHIAIDGLHSGTISNMYTGKIFTDWIKENV